MQKGTLCLAYASFKCQAKIRPVYKAQQSTLALCCAIAAGTDPKEICVCWRKYKADFVAIVATTPEPFKTKLQSDADNSDKLCSGVNTGFATSPSFLLIVAAALSMTFFTTRSPLE